MTQAALLVRRVRKELREQPEPKVPRVCKALQEPKALPVLLVESVQLELLDHKARQAQLAP